MITPIAPMQDELPLSASIFAAYSLSQAEHLVKSHSCAINELF